MTLLNITNIMETNLTKNLLALILLLIPIRSSFSQLSNKLEPIDVFDLEYVSNPQISSQGDKILYQRNFKDITTNLFCKNNKTKKFICT